ncbi:hypothetical protein [Streptomyces sp. MZ04]|uniref:hypothetical protein n=1 Tax=Streptomyces sp. MZ04 TaxID=2559236 RepID=UPI00107ECCD8|nr:hypothetical protein [Streptomyces sp. MZ04]TGB15642.1 hypothetical protein E2651_01940 [Streptomyces sp. MZ04]
MTTADGPGCRRHSTATEYSAYAAARNEVGPSPNGSAAQAASSTNAKTGTGHSRRTATGSAALSERSHTAVSLASPLEASRSGAS